MSHEFKIEGDLYTCTKCKKTYNCKYFCKNVLNESCKFKLFVETVDVIIPCHNYERYLEQAIYSIKEQEKHFLNLNILVVDDASDNGDEVEEICVNNGVKYLRVHERSPNEARKAGFNNTNGEFIVFLDADDMLTEDYLTKSLDALLKTKADVAVTNVQEFEDSKRKWKPLIADINENNFCHVGCMVRRQAIIDSKAFEQPNEYPAEDWEFWRRIYNSNKLFTKVESYYHYRKHHTSRFNNLPNRRELSNKVISAYYTMVPDPQRGVNWEKDDVSIVKNWVESALSVRLKPIILTDHPLPRIQAIYPELEVVEYPPEEEGHLFKWKSIYNYLKQNETTLRTIFTTDLSDVTFNNNPYRCFTINYDYYIGTEPVKIGNSKWMVDRLERFYKKKQYKLHNKQLYNCGIVGGWIGPMLRLARNMYEEIQEHLGTHNLTDMPPLNKLLHESDVKIFTGAPLHSVFKKYQTDRKDVCIVHK